MKTTTIVKITSTTAFENKNYNNNNINDHIDDDGDDDNIDEDSDDKISKNNKQ